jgi:arylsulfatase A-like enzyme
MLSRRGFLAATAAPAILRPAQQRRPNVLMIAADDWNDWVGVFGGHPQVKTPNLDRLAAQSVRFTEAHCAAPICNPSRTALMTGRRPSTSGVYDNDQPWRLAMPDVVTLPQHFRLNGYRVEEGGKLFHHGRGYNDPLSWDRYFFWNPAAEANGWHDNYSFPPDPEPARPVTPMAALRRNFDWAPLQVRDEEMPDFRLASWASDFLRSRQEKPFFLGAGFFRPHIPWFVPKRYFDMYPIDEIILPPVKEDDLADVPPAGRTIALNDDSRQDLVISTGNWRKAVQAYLACISFADTMIGRLLDAFEQSPHRDNTIVVLWSDHGYHLGEKWHWHKHALWYRATHVPLLIRVPGLTRAGAVCSRPVSLVDLYPTLADVAGLPAPGRPGGSSLRPLLENPRAEWKRPALTTFLRANHGLTGERWHYIRYADGSDELYDRQQDPHEWINLAGRSEHAARKKEMAAWLPESDAPDAPRAKDYRFDPATVRWLPKAG